MKFNLRAKVIFAITVLLIVLFPIIVNCCYLQNAPFDSWMRPSEWTKFWGQYIWGALSVIMLVIAWKTLITTKEANRPFICIDFVDRGNNHAFLRCRNLGNSIASNIVIKLEESFIDKVKLDIVRDTLLEINNTEPFVLPAKEERIWDLFLMPSYGLNFKYSLQGDKSAFDYKGTSLSEEDWKDNEKIFNSNLIQCMVEYNKEYSYSFQLDYNNILDGVSSTKKISGDLFSIMFVLSKINDTITEFTKKHGTEQDK